MKKEKNIALLYSLIKINNDRIEGYKAALKEIDEPELQRLLLKLIDTSRSCKLDLVEQIVEMGGNAKVTDKTHRNFFSSWMGLKMALGGRNGQAILNACKYGEDITVNRYKQALRNNLDHITAEQQNILNQHYTLILTDRKKILELREPIDTGSNFFFLSTCSCMKNVTF